MKIGILGSGQLARMLSLSAVPLGHHISCIGNTTDCAAECCEVLPISYDSKEELLQWASSCDVITFENENINTNIVKDIAHVCPVYPPVASIEMAQDRLTEKNTLNKANIPTAHYYAVDSLEDLYNACKKYGIPCIIKTRRFGYDGKGQYRITSYDDIPKAWEDLKDNTGGLIYEGFIDFEYEVSQICSVSKNGDICFYPLTHNIHKKGILLESHAPFYNATLEELSHTFAKNLVKSLDYVGTLCIEFFVKDNNLIANEIAPRVHNSGHWTIDGSVTSQFENHMRAVSGLALGSTHSEKTVMYNCIGKMPKTEDTCDLPYVKRHDYAKDARFGRKVGHLTIVVKNQDAKDNAEKIQKLVEQSLDF